MSIRTQFALIFLLVMAVSSFTMASRAQASPRDDVNNAFNEFYRRFRASADKSVSTIKQLESEILKPALKKAQESTNPDESVGPEAPTQDSQTRTEAPQQPIMDAKDVPREIDFPGARPKAHKPAARPSASPAAKH